MQAKVTKSCLRHGYEVRQGRNYAQILGCPNDAGRVVRWEAEDLHTYTGTLRVICETKRQARLVATFFVGSSNHAAAMHKGAGGDFDDYLAGRVLTLPHHWLS